MANQSYCRFENTLTDMKDCSENMDDPEQLSSSEREARALLIELCINIAEEYGDQDF